MAVRPPNLYVQSLGISWVHLLLIFIASSFTLIKTRTGVPAEDCPAQVPHIGSVGSISTICKKAQTAGLTFSTAITEESAILAL